MKRRWRVGVVYDSSVKGKGGHGTQRAFAGLPGVEVVLADPNEEGLTGRMKDAGASSRYASWREMIEKGRVDVVAVCSRLPGDHFEIVKEALERGVHVFCEKPMTSSLEEADAIESLAERRGLKVAVAHLARHAQVFRAMKRLLEEGAIGRPLAFYGRGKEDERGGGEDMIVLGTHVFDLANFLFGPPESVFAEVRYAGRPVSKDERVASSEPVGPCSGDEVFARFRFANGAGGVFESRKGLCKGPVRMGVTVVGESGSLSVRYDMERKLRLRRSSLPPEEAASCETLELVEDRVAPEGSVPLDYASGWPQPARYFADGNRFAALDLLRAIDEDGRPAASASDARVALEMVYGVYASALSGRLEILPLKDRKHPLEG